jgi:hypothetical protein
MKKVLLIWEEVPEATKVYLLEPNEEEYELLLQCHGVYLNDIGVPEDHPINNLSVKLTEWESNLVKFDSPLQLSGDYTVILSGFIL